MIAMGPCNTVLGEPYTDPAQEGKPGPARRCEGGDGVVVRMRRAADPTVGVGGPAQVHVVVVGCGRVGSGLARMLGGMTATPWPSSTGRRRPSAGCRDDFDGQTVRRRRLRPRPPRRRRHRARPTPWPRSPTATTPTSSWPASPGRPTASSRSSPASTTPAGRRSTSASASPPSPRCSGRPSGCCAASSPTAGEVEWIDPSAKVVLVERLVPRGLVGRKLAELEERRLARAVAVVPARAVAQLPDPALVLQEGDVLYLRRRRRSTARRPPGRDELTLGRVRRAKRRVAD